MGPCSSRTLPPMDETPESSSDRSDSGESEAGTAGARRHPHVARIATQASTLIPIEALIHFMVIDA